jgi:SAM-dependent methyltransferase
VREPTDDLLPLATAARYRILAWPRYDTPEDLERLSARYGSLLADRDDVCLCLRHDPRSDGELAPAMALVQSVLPRLLGEVGLTVLVVDDDLPAARWPALGRAVTAALSLPSSAEPARRALLDALGRPVVETPGGLRAVIEGHGADPQGAPVFPSSGARLRIDVPTLFLIRGEPGQGKSTLAEAFSRRPRLKHLPYESASIPTRSALITLDTIYVRFVREERAATIPASWTGGLFPEINRHYLEVLDDEGRRAFAERVLREIGEALRSTEREVVVDGWHLRFLEEEIRTRHGASANVLAVDLEDHVVRIDGLVAEDAKVPLGDGESFESHRERSLRRYGEVWGKVAAVLRGAFAEQMRGGTKYQSYEDLGQAADNSRSAGKLASLHLPALRGLRVLDVGCNAGYFSIRCRQAGASYVLGIDRSVGDLALATAYRDRVYELDGVDFRRIDALELPEEPRFDVVLALSVFHYFRARQDEFLGKVERILEPGGLLVLECGLSQEGGEAPHVQKYARAVDGDDPCWFPNLAALREMTKAFRWERFGPSVDQRGDGLSRFVIHLRKSPHGSYRRWPAGPPPSA